MSAINSGITESLKQLLQTTSSEALTQALRDWLPKHFPNIRDNRSIYGSNEDVDTLVKLRRLMELYPMLVSMLPLVARAGFISPGKVYASVYQFVRNAKTSPFDPRIIGWTRSDGVQADIGKFLPQVAQVLNCASQFNCGEAMDPSTAPVGRAEQHVEGDRTQGPNLLKTHKGVFELLNAVLANQGWNSLGFIPDLHLGASYRHGYLMPVSDEAALAISTKIASDGGAITNPVTVFTTDTGKQVTIVHGAAPAGGEYAEYFTPKTNPGGEGMLALFYGCALASFLSQLQVAINTAKETANPVEAIIYPVGMGAFGNDPVQVANALHDAVMFYQPELLALKIKVRVMLFHWQGVPNAPTKAVVNQLGLQESTFEEAAVAFLSEAVEDLGIVAATPAMASVEDEDILEQVPPMTRQLSCSSP
jgi:hypothetical protein